MMRNCTVLSYPKTENTKLKLFEELGGIEEFRLEPSKKLFWASAKKVVLEVSGERLLNSKRC